MENFHIKQENTIKGLENEIGQLNSEIEDKDIKYKQLDKSYLSIIRVIEEHKKTISKLQDQLNKKQIEDKNLRNQIYEKEQEISLLRSFINSIKYENRMNNFQNSLSARQSAKKKNKNNDSQNLILPKINSAYGNKQLQTNNDNINNNFENNLNYNNVLTEDDPEEENMKGINNLMNKILNE
jgi:chromosome segregation ATPase